MVKLITTLKTRKVNSKFYSIPIVYDHRFPSSLRTYDVHKLFRMGRGGPLKLREGCIATCIVG